MIDIDDFKETFTPVLYILSMIVVFGMLTLEVGFNIFKDPTLEIVWYINVGLLFLSNIILTVQAREGETPEGWETPLKVYPREYGLELPKVPRGTSIKPPISEVVERSTLSPSSEADEVLEQKKPSEEAPTLDKATKAQLDKPTKEALDRLKEVLGLTEGSVAYKHGAVYSVQYDRLTKRHKWQRLGSWSELRQKLEAPQNPS